jgi:hypothetical protein
MEYVCAGYEFHSDRAHVVKDKFKIQGDVDRRTKEGKLAVESLQFWKDTLNQAEEFQNNLTNIEARLKTIKIGVTTICYSAGHFHSTHEERCRRKPKEIRSASTTMTSMSMKFNLQ